MAGTLRASPSGVPTPACSGSTSSTWVRGGSTGVWVLPTGNTSISGLSWAPDSRRLAYTLGRGVGGQGSGYALLDTSKTGGELEQVPAPTREFDQDGRSCPVLRSLWLGRTGRFAVFAACVDRNELLVVQSRPDPHLAQQGSVLAVLPDSATHPRARRRGNGRWPPLARHDRCCDVPDRRIARDPTEPTPVPRLPGDLRPALNRPGSTLYESVGSRRTPEGSKNGRRRAAGALAGSARRADGGRRSFGRARPRQPADDPALGGRARRSQPHLLGRGCGGPQPIRRTSSRRRRCCKPGRCPGRGSKASPNAAVRPARSTRTACWPCWPTPASRGRWPRTPS